MAIRSVIATLLWVSLTLGRTLSVTTRHDSTDSDIVHTRVRIQDLPPMDLNRIVGSPWFPPSLNVSQHHGGEEDPSAIEKRARFTGNWQPTGPGRCLEPASGASPLSSDCLRICNHIRTYHSPYIIGPFEIEKVEVGFCIFEMVNLLACDTVDLDSLSLLYPICHGMYTSCAIDSYDRFVQGGPPKMASTLSGLPAAPPYTFQNC